MGVENRTVTIVPWGATQDASATPPEINCPRYSDVNDWQDLGCRAMSLDGTMTPVNVGFEDIEGCQKFYFQSVEIADGAGTEIGHVYNPHNYDTAFDLHGRIIECTCWTIAGGAINLPKGANYDPDNSLNAPTSHLWYTGTGAADGAPPTGDYWTPWANIYIYCGDSNSPTSLRCYNNTGASFWLVLMGSITQLITT